MILIAWSLIAVGVVVFAFGVAVTIHHERTGVRKD